MRYYRVDGSPGSRLLVQTDDGLFDLTSANDDLDSFVDLSRAAAITDTRPDDIATGLIHDALELPEGALEDVIRPIVPSEVWAAGVTYEISEQARESESGKPEIYLDVYESDRPELFFKATPSRTVGPNAHVGVRSDSEWNVPEPELGVVLHREEVVGFTIGNDVSSRSIEGRNPLYLPQAKVYERCCSIGPCVVSAESIPDPHDLRIEMTIGRGGDIVYEGTTHTSRMTRTCAELVDYYLGHNAVPETTVLLTGTALVPEDGFTLAAGDVVTIDVEGIGRLANPVTTV